MTPATASKAEFEIISLPVKTYGIDFKNGRAEGKLEGPEAMRQAIYKILNTERYDYLIYSWSYGIELSSLFGMGAPAVYPSLKTVITEALTADDRIMEVYNFEFKANGSATAVSFEVKTSEGVVFAETEVRINV